MRCVRSLACGVHVNVRSLQVAKLVDYKESNDQYFVEYT